MVKLLRIVTCVECPAFSWGYSGEDGPRIAWCRHGDSHRYIGEWAVGSPDVEIPSWCPLPDEEVVE